MDTTLSTAADSEELRRRFLQRLLRDLDRSTRRLTELAESANDEREVERLARVQGRLGWGWAVATELAGSGGAPERREPRGAAWLAACLDSDPLEAIGAWPRVAPAHADWRSAYALVLFTLVGLEHGGRRVGRRAHEDGCAWTVFGAAGQAPTCLTDELTRLFDRSPLAVGEGWRFELPEAWRRATAGERR